MQELTIKIFKATDEDGYYYDIYNTTDDELLATTDSIDGGLCTTTMQNALTMATEQAQILINQSK